jgi:hypothetical protein
LLGDTEFDPDSKLKVKCVDGALVETYGTVEACIQEGNFKVQFPFHLVNKQVDLIYDGIIGRDLLQKTRAKICYKSKTVTLIAKSQELTKKMLYVDRERKIENAKSLRLPKRSEVIVKVVVEDGEEGAEGVIDKLEIAEGIYLASSLTKIKGKEVVTSILNTRETEAVVEVPTVKWEKYTPVDPHREDQTPYMGAISPIEMKKTEQNREGEVLRNLRLDHLNPEEQRVTENTCRDYQDIFYLPGDRLSSTNAIKHTINVVPGTSPINSRPYTLPEAQKAEVDRQVTKLLRERIIVESNSPWNSPLLVVPKKEDASGEKKWRLVVDFRKLNEKKYRRRLPSSGHNRDTRPTRAIQVF